MKKLLTKTRYLGLPQKDRNKGMTSNAMQLHIASSLCRIYTTAQNVSAFRWRSCFFCPFCAWPSYRTRPKSSPTFVQQTFPHLKQLYLIRTRSVEGDECLDNYSGETLERRRNFTAVSLDALACLNGRVPTVNEKIDCRQEQEGQVCSRSLWRYTEQYMHVQ